MKRRYPKPFTYLLRKTPPSAHQSLSSLLFLPTLMPIGGFLAILFYGPRGIAGKVLMGFFLLWFIIETVLAYMLAKDFYEVSN